MERLLYKQVNCQLIPTDFRHTKMWLILIYKKFEIFLLRVSGFLMYRFQDNVLRKMKKKNKQIKYVNYTGYHPWVYDFTLKTPENFSNLCRIIIFKVFLESYQIFGMGKIDGTNRHWEVIIAKTNCRPLAIR